MRTSISGRRANRREDAPLAAAVVVPLLRGLITATIITLAPSFSLVVPYFWRALSSLETQQLLCAWVLSVTPSCTISGERSQFFLLTIFKEL